MIPQLPLGLSPRIPLHFGFIQWFATCSFRLSIGVCKGTAAFVGGHGRRQTRSKESRAAFAEVLQLGRAVDQLVAKYDLCLVSDLPEAPVPQLAGTYMQRDPECQAKAPAEAGTHILARKGLERMEDVNGSIRKLPQLCFGCQCALEGFRV